MVFVTLSVVSSTWSCWVVERLRAAGGLRRKFQVAREPSWVADEVRRVAKDNIAPRSRNYSRCTLDALDGTEMVSALVGLASSDLPSFHAMYLVTRPTVNRSGTAVRRRS